MFPPSVFLSAHPSNALSEVEKNHYAVLWASCLCIMLSHSHERGGKRGPEPRRTWSGVPCQDGLYTLMGKERRWGVNGKKKTSCGTHGGGDCGWGICWQKLVTLCWKMWMHKCVSNTKKLHVLVEVCGMSHALGSGRVIPRHSLFETLSTVISGRLYR